MILRRAIPWCLCLALASVLCAPSAFLVAQVVVQDDNGAAAQDNPEQPTAADPLAQAIEAMRTVEKRIAQGDTGDETRQMQQQVIRKLQELIEQAQRPRQPNQQPQSPPNSPDQKPQPDPDQQKKDGQQPNGGADDAAAGQEPQQSKKEAADATERIGQPGDKEAELTRRRDLIKDYWGHLPPAVREQILNIEGEKYLPKYEELIRRYFEALAEQGRR